MKETTQATLIYFSIILLIGFGLLITKNANCLEQLLIKLMDKLTEDEKEPGEPEENEIEGIVVNSLEDFERFLRGDKLCS